MKLVIAEKPAVAMSLATVLGATERKDGYLEGSGYLVSWCVGHLLELAQPEAYKEQYAKWRYEDLPILPENWKYEVPKDKKTQLALLCRLMKDKRVDSVVCATDAGREGELIFRLVYEYAGCNKPIAMIIGMVTLPFPVVYLYGSAGIDAFIGAIFYLVAANRVNKHGLLFAWAAVYGVIQGVMGYMFLIPYFLIVALVAELCMVGKNTYQSAVRNRIGWMVNSIGNFVGCAVPLWWSWDSYQEMAANSGFDANTLNMQLSMVTSPALMLLGVVITAVLAILGTLFGQRLLRKHFQKAGIVG